MQCKTRGVSFNQKQRARTFLKNRRWIFMNCNKKRWEHTSLQVLKSCVRWTRVAWTKMSEIRPWNAMICYHIEQTGTGVKKYQSIEPIGLEDRSLRALDLNTSGRGFNSHRGQSPCTTLSFMRLFITNSAKRQTILALEKLWKKGLEKRCRGKCTSVGIHCGWLRKQ